jgi:hypothetical protein
MKWTSNPALKCILNLIWSVRGSIVINADLKKGNVEQIQNSLFYQYDQSGIPSLEKSFDTCSAEPANR